MDKALFLRIVDMFNTGDVSAVNETFGPDYIDHQKPEWLTVNGPEEFVEIVKLARTSLPNLKVTVSGTLISDTDTVVGRLLWTSDKGQRETIEMLRTHDSKFAEHWGAETWSKPKGAG